MSLTFRVLLALVLGLAIGLLIAALGPGTAVASAAMSIEPLGTLFINAIRMTVIPLVVASLIAGVASVPDARAIGRVGTQAIIFFLVALFAAGALAALIAPAALAYLTIPPEASAALLANAAAGADALAESTARMPGFRQWLLDLVPPNPIRAAADGAMLPLILFSILFGLSLTRIGVENRAAVVRFFQGTADAMLVLVRWVLWFAPIGVFALAVPLAIRLGATAVQGIVYYIVLVALISVIFIALLYVAVGVLTRVPVRRFAKAAAPAQAVAFSARSSLAALPAMIEGATTRLALPSEITAFLLPLAASMFRVGGAIGMTVGVLFVARLYGLEMGTAQVLTIVVTSVLLTFSVPGVPGGSILVMVPVMLAVNVPAEGALILLAVDTIPDMFRTTANVTGHMAAAAMIGRPASTSGGHDDDGTATAPVTDPGIAITGIPRPVESGALIRDTQPLPRSGA